MNQSTTGSGAILVVEDNDSIRTIVKTFLEAAGYSVMVASDGAIGLASYKEYRPAIVLLLTDVAMPRMNGLDLADHVLQIDRQMPVLFMSGTANEADRGYGCVAKPFRGGELVERVEAAIQRAAARSARPGESERVANLDQTDHLLSS